LLEGLQKTVGTPFELMRSVGGGTQNSIWQELKASIIGKPIEIPKVTDVSAQGAALIAAVGVGVFRNAEAAVNKPINFNSVSNQVKSFSPFMTMLINRYFYDYTLCCAIYRLNSYGILYLIKNMINLANQHHLL
jgi:sugar (pentulose or hexulose) kinase